MYAGRSYPLIGLIAWTRRDIYKLLVLAVVPTVLYRLAGWTFLSLSWVPIALLGTAVSLIVSFKNNAAYARLWEARQIYGGILNVSRAFGVMVRDFLPAPADRPLMQVIFQRHYAWLTALRYQLREPRAWENMADPANAEFLKTYYRIPERETPLAAELVRYLRPEELAYILGKKNRAVQLLARQSAQINALDGRLTEFQLQQLQALITGFYDHQGRAERIKNFPYPRNYSTITTVLLYLFVLLVPYGLLKEFTALGTGTFLAGDTVWFNIPFALLLTWVFLTLDRVGESSVNPFEGGPNDVPITAMSRTIELDMRELLDETDLPPALAPVNEILL